MENSVVTLRTKAPSLVHALSDSSLLLLGAENVAQAKNINNRSSKWLPGFLANLKGASSVRKCSIQLVFEMDAWRTCWLSGSGSAVGGSQAARRQAAGLRAPASTHLAAHAAQLPSGSAARQLSGSQPLSSSAAQRLGGSAASAVQPLSRSAAQQLSRSAAQRLSGSAAQQLSGSAAQQLSRSAAQPLSGSAAQSFSGSCYVCLAVRPADIYYVLR